MPREASKCREWEKERRDRLKTGFTALGKLLPCYDPSTTLSKVDILHKAATYIEELQVRIKDLLSAESTNKPEREEIKKLHCRIKKLLIRNEQLTNLLKDAGIKLPTEYGVIKKFKDPRPWSNRITPEQAKLLAKRESQKENELKNSKGVKKTPNKAKKLRTSMLPPKQRKAIRKSDFKVKNSSLGIIKSSVNLNITQKNLISFVSTQSCFIITNAPSNPISHTSTIRTTTVVTNSRIFSSPIVASTVQPTPSIVLAKTSSATLKPLTAGTLLVANGNLLPVLPSPAIIPNPSLLTNPSAVMSTLPVNNTTLIVVPKSNAKDLTLPISVNRSGAAAKPCEPTRPLICLKPKIDLTRTTQVNKVPIPASRYANSFLLLPTNPNCGAGVKPKAGHKRRLDKNKSNGEILRNKRVNRSAAKPTTTEPPKVIKEAVANVECDGLADQKVIGNTAIEQAGGVGQELCDNADGGPENKNEEAAQSESKKRKLRDLTDVTEATPKSNPEADYGKKTSTYSINSLCNENEANPTSVTTITTSAIATTTTTTSSDSPQADGGSGEKRSEKPEVVAADAAGKEENKLSAILESVTAADRADNSEKRGISSQVSPTSGVEGVETAEQDVCSEDVQPSQKVSTKDEPTKSMDLRETLTHSELSNDIFAHLSHVSAGSQNPESTSPTAAFLLAFPIVSSLTSLKVTEVMEEETSDSQHGTPTLLQIGTMDTTKTTQSQPDNLTPNLLNLDNFSFFSSPNFYQSFDGAVTATATKPTPSEPDKKGEYDELSGGAQNSKDAKTVCNNSETAASQIAPASQASSTTKSFSTVAAAVSSAAQRDEKVDASHPQKILATPMHAPSSTMYNPSGAYNQACYTNVVTTTGATIQQSAKAKHADKLPCTYYSAAPTSYVLPQYNTFNPFTDIPKSSSSYANATKAYNESLYTNNANYSYNYHGDNFNINYCSAKTNAKHDNKAFYGLNYGNAYDYKNGDGQKYEARNQQFGSYYNQNHQQTREKPTSGNQAVKASSKSTANNSRQPVNWMTTPDLRQQSQSDFLVPPFTKEMEFTQNSIYTNSFVSGSQTTYFNSTAPLYAAADLHNSFGDGRKIDGPFPPIAANTFQRNDVDENQFSWSPSKLPQLLDPPHNFVSTTLPTLVGDLALGTTQPALPFLDQNQKVENNKNVRAKDNNRRSKSHVGFDNQSNFLSVSQLVDHSKAEGVVPPPRIASRRNSGNRSSKANLPTKANRRVQKAAENKESNTLQCYNGGKIASVSEKSHVKQSNEFSVQNNMDNSNWTVNASKAKHVNKNVPSSYSAEALIAHQPPQVDSMVMKQRHQENYPAVTKSLPVSFLADNLISYFPPVDIPQENSFIQQNQNYQGGSFGHNFPSSIQTNNVYSSNSFVPNAPTITTSYLQSTNFMPDIGNYEYSPVISENVFPYVTSRAPNKNVPTKQNHPDDKRNVTQTSISCSVNSSNAFNNKKSKRKQTTEGNLPGFVDFAFLSMPGAINSPILPDDFHAHSNFLPPPTPTQLYPCKNPLYPKQPVELVPSTLLPLPSVSRTGIQHPEISPLLNNVGTTSLTNFNLSTIFPEINKGSGPLPDIYADSGKSKDYIQRDFLGNTTQVPFTSKPNLSMSYINSTSTA